MFDLTPKASDAGDGTAAVPTAVARGAAPAVREATPSGERVAGRVLASAALATVLALAVGGAWVLTAVSRAHADAATARATVIAKSLAAAVEPLVVSNDLTRLRRMVTEIQAQDGVAELAVSLPDGSIVAHSQPTRNSVRQLPDTWSASSSLAQVAATPTPDTAVETATITGRGPMIVTVRAARPVGLPAELQPTLFLLGLVGATTLGALYLIYRRARTPLRTLSLIAQSLREIRSGAVDVTLLRMDPRFGPEADGWNTLIDAAGPSGRRSATGTSSGIDDATASTASLSDVEQAVNILPTGVIIVDRMGCVRHANNIGAVLLGQTQATVRGMPVADLIADATVAEFINGCKQGRAVRRTVEVRRDTPVGEVVLRVHCRPLRKDDAGAALLTLDDVTQQRAADTSRGLFVAQATHELRTPLTNMRLAVEAVMDDEFTLPAGVAPHMNMVAAEVRRLERIVSDMLAVSEIEAGSLKLTRGEVQLERLVADLESDHRRQATERNITLSVILPPKYPQFFGDREKLGQALHNLLGNAVKYTPDGGTVTLSVSESADGRFMAFSITDNGIGISPDDKARLFNRFARGSDPRVAKITGTGLGLALSREIARLHGGDITVESQLDKGSTFTLSVPLSRQEHRNAA